MVAPSTEMMVDTTPTLDPATITSSTQNNAFPPCTADQCHVDEQEKKKSEAKERPSCEMTEKCVNACAAYGKVCPCAARIASHAACDAMQELQKDSNVFSTEKPDFVYLNADDIQIGEKLGEGGFSNVNRCIVTASNHPDTNQELAVKYLKRKAMVDLHHFKHGAADLAVEAYFLQTLNHPNIVKLHGLTAGSVESNVASGKECGFFIVVDRLYDTLEHKIDTWRKADIEACKAGGTGGFQKRSERRENKRAELVERCEIAISIAKAMEYLHSLNIIFRDLKPDNIGFDQEGVLKLFDFGLAKELKPANQNKASGMYRLTGHTGSRRYMAPEVALDQDYNETVDVFSFGILLWELCAAQKPFFGYSANKHMQLVVQGNERPKMDSAHTSCWPAALQNLMKKCWARDPHQRPSFTQIIQVLEHKVLTKVGGSTNTSPRNVLTSQESLGLEEAIEEGCEKNEEHPPRGFFSNFLHPMRARNATTGSHDVATSTPEQEVKKAQSFKHLHQPVQRQRSRSWGFPASGKK
mmetsp:Transcript_37087/g.77068  ORF Transcript_37087/g.77068 Transcript_37087/m.77068 type:complete len:525 (-) Transcript_37087:465-2039(-)